MVLMRSLLQETHHRQHNSSSLNNSISSNQSGGIAAALPSGVLDNLRGSSALNLHSCNIDSNTGALMMLGGANLGGNGSMSANHSMIGGRFSTLSNNSFRASETGTGTGPTSGGLQQDIPMETEEHNGGYDYATDGHDDNDDDYAPMTSMASALTEFPMENEDEIKIQGLLHNLDPHEEYSSGSSHSLKKGRPYRAPTLWNDTIQRSGALNDTDETETETPDPTNKHTIAPSLSEVLADQYYNTDNDYDNTRVSWFGQRYMVPINLYPSLASTNTSTNTNAAGKAKYSSYDCFSKKKLFYAPFQKAFSIHKKIQLVSRLQKHREMKKNAAEAREKEYQSESGHNQGGGLGMRVGMGSMEQYTPPPGMMTMTMITN
mgnify:CR=1 FL=1